MNHIYLIRLVLLKRPGFQSQKYGMPTITAFSYTDRQPMTRKYDVFLD